ncbi:hypothetical protein AB0A73_21565 [Glycomyces sp. NPDC047369]
MKTETTVLVNGFDRLDGASRTAAAQRRDSTIYHCGIHANKFGAQFSTDGREQVDSTQSDEAIACARRCRGAARFAAQRASTGRRI